MIRISEEAKHELIKKTLSRSGKTTAEIALENNIGCSTLNKWVKRFKLENNIESHQSIKSISTLPLAERFKHLEATTNLDEVRLGAYCREHGLYSFQLQQWKDEFMSQGNDQKKNELQAELKALKAENKLLKRDLLRKDRALAETTALLILKKKADLLFGELEDD